MVRAELNQAWDFIVVVVVTLVKADFRSYIPSALEANYCVSNVDFWADVRAVLLLQDFER